MRRPKNNTASTDKQGISGRVCAARNRKNLNQVQLSELSGVPLSTLKSIESGATENPHTATLNALAQALDADAGFLRTGDQPNTPTAPKV